jgi:hypothetical protein
LAPGAQNARPLSHEAHSFLRLLLSDAKAALLSLLPHLTPVTAKKEE